MKLHTTVIIAVATTIHTILVTTAEVVAWPTADISFMDPEPAIHVVYNLKKEDDPERFDQLLKEMALNTEPWNAAGGFGVQDIIDPAETRDFLIKMLALYQNRLTKGIGKHLMHNWPTSY